LGANAAQAAAAARHVAGAERELEAMRDEVERYWEIVAAAREPILEPIEITAGRPGSSGGGGGGGGGRGRRADVLADLQREIDLHGELIRRFGEGEEALERLRAAYEAMADARRMGL